MRRTQALDALFPKTRTGILSAAFTRSEKWWYLSELAEYLHTSPSSLQRELASLVASGILRQRREGTRTYFKADARSPMFKELQGLFEKTAGLIPALQQALEPFARQITCAFVYGSVAQGKETAVSDVDLMVIGSLGLADLAPALRKAEARLEREINVTHYSVKEFRNKVARKDHFLSTVIRGPKEFVKGSQRDLDEITG
jgi:predicted nucleotidyltransferase